jgi:hypothetical protein
MVRFCLLILAGAGIFYLFQQHSSAAPSDREVLGIGLAALTFAIAAVVRVPAREAPKRPSGFFIR